MADDPSGLAAVGRQILGLTTMNRRFGTQILFWLLACLIGMSSAQAQNTSSSLTGRVIDPAGEPVAGATVEIVHVPSNTVRTETTIRKAATPRRVCASAARSRCSSERRRRRRKTTSTCNWRRKRRSISPSAAPRPSSKASRLPRRLRAQTFQPDNKGVASNVSSANCRSSRIRTARSRRSRAPIRTSC